MIDYPPLPTLHLDTTIHSGIGKQGVPFVYAAGPHHPSRCPVEFTPAQLRALRNRIDEILEIVEP